MSTSPQLALSRRSDRVRLRMRIQVSGTDARGASFAEECYTETVSLNGASIAIRHAVTRDQLLSIRLGDREARARVVGQLDFVQDTQVYGVAFTDASSSHFWGITFPGGDEREGPVGRLLLQCSTCAHFEVVHLHEVEMMVFESNHGSMERICPVCEDMTVWSTPDEADPSPNQSAGAGRSAAAVDLSSAQPSAPAPTGKHVRRHPRVQLKNAKACIRRYGLEEDVVPVVDVSRGGVRFRSPQPYSAGAWVQVAVPFTLGSANIFVSGRVIRVQNPPLGDTPGEYAIQYAIPDR